jgi:alkanesulfonate monooxygenase SsuD/methylene tetrahydromethanopterin reductase-like flavin-dependent oxidoreductase (luciferase family)
MKLGVSISSTHDHDGPALMIERAATAYRAGFTSLSIGDHHNMPVPYAQNTPMLGRLLAEWPDRPAGCLFLVPLWHPVLMAEQIGTLAAIHGVASDQPFIVQTGIGYGRDQFRAFNANMSTRGGVLEESIRVVKALLAGDVVDSEPLGLVGGRVGLRPPGPVEWWIGGGVDVALRRAAEMGDAWYAGPGTDTDRGRAMVGTYRAAGGGRAILRKDALVLSDGDAARRMADELVADGYRGLTVDDLIVGGADDAAEQLAAYAEAGFDEVIIRCMKVPQDLALETLETLGPLQ